MIARRHPRTHLMDWGFIGRNDRCPKCGVHRFDWEVERREYDLMMGGETNHAFGSGKCGRCSHRGAFQLDARGCKAWYAT